MSVIETLRVQNPEIVLGVDESKKIYSIKGAKLAGHNGQYQFYLVGKNVYDSLLLTPPPRTDCQKFGVDTLDMWTWRNVDEHTENNEESTFLDIYSFLKRMLGNPTEQEEKNGVKKFVWDFLNVECKSYFLLFHNKGTVMLWVRTCRNIVH